MTVVVTTLCHRVIYTVVSSNPALSLNVFFAGFSINTNSLNSCDWLFTHHSQKVYGKNPGSGFIGRSNPGEIYKN
jgi:hypothetical protein